MSDRLRTQNAGRACFGLLGALIISLAACGSGEEATDAANGAAATPAFETTFVGSVEGTEAFIAIAVEGGKVWAYACDGEGTSDDSGVADYLTGTFDGADLVAADDEGASLVATRDDDTISGSVTLPDGTVGAFTAVKATGQAGWFSAQVGDAERSEVGSWIRLADGQVRGKVLTTVTNSSGVPASGEADQLGGGSVPPEAVPTGALKCYFATKRHRKVYNDPNSTDSQINGSNNERMDACGFFNNT